MAGVQLQGSNGYVAKVDETGALHVVIRPPDTLAGGGGVYRVAESNGATGIAAGAGAASEIFAFRNASSTKTARVRKVTLSMWTGATGFTAGVSLFVMKVARAFTVGPTAGTTIVLSGNNCKIDPDSASAECVAYIADDSVLTSGTETADATAVGQLAVTTSNAVQTVHAQSLVLYDAEEAAYPFELEQNDGFIIYATVPATGVWFVLPVVEWEEYANSAA